MTHRSSSGTRYHNPPARSKGNVFAIATAACQKQGKSDFSRGGAGQKCRSKLAEKLKHR